MEKKKRKLDTADAPEQKTGKEQKVDSGAPKSKLLQMNTSCQRYIFTPPICLPAGDSTVTPTSLMKALRDEPDLEDRARDMILEAKIDPDHKHFQFWYNTHPKLRLTYQDLRAHVQDIPRYDDGAKSYHVRTTPYSGVNMEELLPDPIKCPCCSSTELPTDYKTMQMSAQYAVNFVEHVLTSIQLLFKINIHHGDLALRNLLVQPTDEEKKEGILRTTLPLLIDFGQCSYPPKMPEEKKVMKEVAHFFCLCRHNIAARCTKERGGEVDQPGWLTNAIVASELPLIQPLVELLESDKRKQLVSDKYTLETLLQHVREVKQKLSA